MQEEHILIIDNSFKNTIWLPFENRPVERVRVEAGRPVKRQLQLSVCGLDSSGSSGAGEPGQVLLSLAFFLDDSQSGSSVVHGN